MTAPAPTATVSPLLMTRPDDPARVCELYQRAVAELLRLADVDDVLQPASAAWRLWIHATMKRGNVRMVDLGKHAHTTQNQIDKGRLVRPEEFSAETLDRVQSIVRRLASAPPVGCVGTLAVSGMDDACVETMRLLVACIAESIDDTFPDDVTTLPGLRRVLALVARDLDVPVAQIAAFLNTDDNEVMGYITEEKRLRKVPGHDNNSRGITNEAFGDIVKRYHAAVNATAKAVRA